jgi:uncharacterized protein
MTIILAAIAVVIGISLGLLGAGGAIVAVPAFLYIGGIDSNLADGYALFVVAISSAVAVALQIQQRLVDWKAIRWFGSFTLVSLILMRGYFDKFFPAQLQEILFGIILIVAAAAMLRKKGSSDITPAQDSRKLMLYGIVIGAISGLLGVGGGFLMTPALVLWAGLDMKHAVASSMVLICVNSAIGVGVDMAQGMVYDWNLVLQFTGLTVIGIITGTLLSRKINSNQLRASFGWLVLVIGLTVLGIELFSLYSSSGIQS